MVEFFEIWLELKLGKRGVTSLEYGLIAGVIVATIAVGFKVLANNLSSKFSGIGTILLGMAAIALAGMVGTTKLVSRFSIPGFYRP